ncbi:MAG: thioredoxin family protein [Bacteroidetes bacterium]|nr:thioredoxin family protein [Bacteroidota bacterium]
MEIVGKENIEKLVASNAMAILYFYNDNCAPCISLRPKVNQMVESEFPEIKLGFVNAVQNSDITASYGIYNSPAILLFIDGKETIRESKYVSVQELRGKINRYYQLYFS